VRFYITIIWKSKIIRYPQRFWGPDDRWASNIGNPYVSYIERVRSDMHEIPTIKNCKAPWDVLLHITNENLSIDVRTEASILSAFNPPDDYSRLLDQVASESQEKLPDLMALPSAPSSEIPYPDLASVFAEHKVIELSPDQPEPMETNVADDYHEGENDDSMFGFLFAEVPEEPVLAEVEVAEAETVTLTVTVSRNSTAETSSVADGKVEEDVVAQVAPVRKNQKLHLRAMNLLFADIQYKGDQESLATEKRQARLNEMRNGNEPSKQGIARRRSSFSD